MAGRLPAGVGSARVRTMTDKNNSYTIKLTPDQMDATARILREGNYRPRRVEYALAAAEGEDCQIVLYQSGKCLVQGKGAADWVTFVLEPQVLGEARLGYEDVLNPEASAPHMGVDESGKGDFFGPLVIAAAYVDETIAKDLKAMNVRDSKTITTDKAAQDLAKKIRARLGEKFVVVSIGPTAYNRLYATMGSVNRILAWGHARAIENECFVVIAGSVGNLPRVHNMDIQYAQSGVFTPCDFAFPTDGKRAEATPNTEMILVSDVDLDLLNELHTYGSVRNLKDRRNDLYEVKMKK